MASIYRCVVAGAAWRQTAESERDACNAGAEPRRPQVTLNTAFRKSERIERTKETPMRERREIDTKGKRSVERHR